MRQSRENCLKSTETQSAQKEAVKRSHVLVDPLPELCDEQRIGEAAGVVLMATSRVSVRDVHASRVENKFWGLHSMDIEFTVEEDEAVLGVRD